MLNSILEKDKSNMSDEKVRALIYLNELNDNVESLKDLNNVNELTPELLNHYIHLMERKIDKIVENIN